MPNKYITYSVKMKDGKKIQVPAEKIQQYANSGASIRMRNGKGEDFTVSVDDLNSAKNKGYHPYSFEHTVVQPRQEIAPKKAVPQTIARPKDYTKAGALVKQLIAPKKAVPQTIARPKDYTKAGALVKQLKEDDDNSFAGIRRSQGLPKGKYTEADVQGVNDRMEQREIDRQRANAERLIEKSYKAANNINADAKESWWQEMLHTASDASHGAGLTETPTVQQVLVENDNAVRSSKAAFNKVNDAEEALTEDRTQRKEDNASGGLVNKAWNKAKRAGRGIVNTAKKVKTWDMGVTDLSNNTALLDAATAYDNGTATEEQQALLDAAALNTEMQNKHGDALTGMYGAGATTAQMIPFMAQMAMNPGTGIGKAAMNGMGKYVAKKLGKSLAEKTIGKFITGAARVAGDTVEGAIANTAFGLPTTFADAADRKTGTVMPAKDENGNVVYSGQREGAEKSASKAFGKAAVANTLEYSTELAGEYFKPIGQLIGGTVSKGLDKIGLNNVNNWLTGLSNKQFVKSYQNFADKTKWNGTFGEYGEEVINNVENAATVGDMNFNSQDDPNSVFNKKTNIDTFLGVALTGGFMSAVKTGTYARNKYKTGKALGDADTKAATVLGADTWKNTKASIDDADDNNIVSVLTEAAKGKTPEQARSIMRYAGMMYADRGANLAQMKDAAEGNGKSAIEQGYDKGRSLTDSNDMVDANNDYKQKRDAVATALGGDENIDAVFANGASGAMLDRMKKSGAYTDGQIKAAEDYVNSKSVYDGMIDKVRDDIDTKVKASDAAVDSHIHKDGMVHPATMRADNRKVYVINGNVAQFKDNNSIDDSNSDVSIIVVDAETGEKEMVPPSFLLRVDTPLNAEQEKQEAADNIRETVSQQASDTIEGVLPFAQGDVYTVNEADGNQHTLQVVADTGDGNVQVISDDKDQITLPKQLVQQMSSAANIARLKQKQANLKQTVLDENDGTDVNNDKQEEVSRPAYNLNDEIAIHDENGNIVRGSVTANENEDGKIQVQTESPVNGSTVQEFTREELDAINSGNEETSDVGIGNTGMASEENVPQSGTEMPEDGNKSEENIPHPKQAPDAIVETQEPTVETKTDESKSSIPIDEDGNMLYHKAPVEDTIKDLYDGNLDDNEVSGFIGANVDEAQKKYDRISSKAPKMSTNKQKYLDDKNAWRQGVEDAKQKLDYWRSVDEENKRITHTTDEEIKKQNDEISGDAAREEAKNVYGEELGNAHSVDDIAADFVRGAKITPESYRKETGLSTADQRKMVGMIASADKGGKSIERLGEDLVQYDNDTYNGRFFHGDSNDARSAIIDALLGNTKKDMKIDADGRVEDFVRQSEEERERFYNEAYHMTYEEYLDYNSAIMPELLRKYSNFDDKEYYDRHIDEILEQQEKEHGKGNDIKGEESGNAGGNKILPKQETDEQSGVETDKDEPAETGAGMHGGNADGYVPESAPGGEVEARGLTEKDAVSIIAQMEETAEVAPEVELTPEAWTEQFGDDGKVSTPIGEVKIGENQYFKIAQKGRDGKLGMVKPTLEHPSVVIEDNRPSDDGKQERLSSFVFIKTFVKKDGSRYYYFASVTVSKDGYEGFCL